jgi:hypothetical protein
MRAFAVQYVSPCASAELTSLPGLTRQSILLRKNPLRKKMDTRVKPAHDEINGRRYGRTSL